MTDFTPRPFGSNGLCPECGARMSPGLHEMECSMWVGQRFAAPMVPAAMPFSPEGAQWTKDEIDAIAAAPTPQQIAGMRGDPPPIVLAGEAPDSRSWLQKLWARLGFGHARPPEMPDKEGFVPGCGCSEIYFVLDWRDWLRVLVSGKVSVAIAHKMDAMPKRWESASELSVLPPGYRHGGV